MKVALSLQPTLTINGNKTQAARSVFQRYGEEEGVPAILEHNFQLTPTSISKSQRTLSVSISLPVSMQAPEVFRSTFRSATL